MAGDLKNREIMIFETVVDVGFRQDRENADQGDAGQKEGRRDRRRDRSGVGVDQQDQGAERITYDLHREGMPAMRRRGASAPPRQAAGERDRAVQLSPDLEAMKPRCSCPAMMVCIWWNSREKSL